MHSFVLQDWTTIRGGGGATVTQGEDGWLDLSPYQDVVFWLDVREASGSATMNFQTSPTMDESLFVSLFATTQAINGSNTPYVLQALMGSALVPVARYVRWQLTGSGTWDATFRVVLAANSPGL